MMKDYLLLFFALTLTSPTWATPVEKAVIAPNLDKLNLSQAPKIQELLKSEAQNISHEFPYRVNLFTQGEISKAPAGNRYAETAQQLSSDTTGLLFFYDLLTNGMRVPHWHANAKEVGTVVEGKMRITIWEGAGQAKIFTVEKNGTWIIPKSTLHALENVGDGKLKFIVSYNSPVAADKDFLTAWTSLPDAVLASAVGLPESEIANIRKTTIDRLSKFDPAASFEKGEAFSTLSNSFLSVKPLYESNLGSITRIDKAINPLMNKMAIQRTIMKPSSLRIPHWYTSGDVLLYVYNGSGFFTIMNNEGKVYHTLIHPGDVISIPIGFFHSFINIGKEDLEVYEVFNRAKDINEITLMNGVQHLSPGMIQGATGLSLDLVKKIKNGKPDSYIIPF